MNYKLFNIINYEMKVDRKKLTDYDMKIFVIRIISNNFVPCKKPQKK